MRRGGRWGLALFLGFAGVFVFLAPFSLMLLPNPGIVRVSSPQVAGIGAFVGGEDGWFRLFPYAERPDAFPAEAPQVGVRSAIVVRTKSDERGSAVTLVRYVDGEGVAVRRDDGIARTIRLRAVAPLAPGRYELRAPRGGLDGGTDLYYFVVSAGR